jgi:hypothetical protein
MFVLLFFFGEYMYCIYRIISYQSFFFIYITDIRRHRLPTRSTWMHPCVVGVRVAHICFSFYLLVSSQSMSYFCSTAWLRYLIYDFLFIPQFFLPFHIIFVHFSLFFFTFNISVFFSYFIFNRLFFSRFRK